ncbi:MAG: beta-galactosidase [Candidatus Giovannonibacteria bacterium]|nr:MAG: beta-galactosidase [Candidatus Giovannonibacteria bacterium]
MPIKTLFWLVGILIILYLLVNYSVPRKQNLSYGVTFSQKFSEELGLNWRENYSAILDDLKVKDLRLVAYWDLTEPEEGKFDFNDLDWQITEAEKRGAKVILVVGRKAPRWPECHIPVWAQKLWTSDVDSLIIDVGRLRYQESLLTYLKTAVEHYKKSSAIIAWQVENEPLFPFGECGMTPISLLNQEIKLVKSLDTRSIILTDSGELGFAWPYLAAKSDIFGTTLYRYVTHKWFGEIKYSLVPAYYFRIKAWWAERVLGKQILISELQAEPWNNGVMNPEIFNEIIDYAERSGFPKAYLWGAEWWYFMKEKQGKPEMWNTVKDLINKQ